MCTPVIGVTAHNPGPESRIILSENYIRPVMRAGGLPIIIYSELPYIYSYLDMIDGLVIVGGGDINPVLYGGCVHKNVYEVSDARDAAEIVLVKEAIARQLPTLGICRGMQIMNVALGGSLIVDIPGEIGRKVIHRGKNIDSNVTHKVKVTSKSGLAKMMGSTNPSPVSRHHQALDRIADEFRVVATASDGLAEAIEYRGEHPWFYGVQWHPEITAAEDVSQQSIFEGLIKAAKKYARP